VSVTGASPATQFAQDIRDGLTAEPRYLHPKYFYDEVGSKLFDAICELPEYYPTRTEAAILAEHGDQIVARAAASALVELGSGSSQKTGFLLAPMLRHNAGALYVPVEISESAVSEAAERLIDEHPGLRVVPVIGDFEAELGDLPTADARLFAFLGSTIGNFTPAQMHDFLIGLGRVMQPEDSLLIGIDLVKDRAELEAAYNDSAGVTARFNKNLLAVVNRELDGDFALDDWQHVAFFDERDCWIEMRLRSARAQRVELRAIDLTIDFAPGDEIRSEISRKFKRAQFGEDLSAAGFSLEGWFSDNDERFALALAQLSSS
jgi:L-histidine N-alpha-methyltransferase